MSFSSPGADSRSATGADVALVLGFERGQLRQRDWLAMVVTGCAMAFLVGLTGVLLAAGLFVLRYLRQPPATGVWRVTTQDMQQAVWIDTHRVVLRKPYRVVYRDEVQPQLFCRLRRRCFGLPH